MPLKWNLHLQRCLRIFLGPPITLSRNRMVHISKRPHSKKFCLTFLVITDPLVVKSIEKVRVHFFSHWEPLWRDVNSTFSPNIEHLFCVHNVFSVRCQFYSRQIKPSMRVELASVLIHRSQLTSCPPSLIWFILMSAPGPSVPGWAWPMGESPTTTPTPRDTLAATSSPPRHRGSFPGASSLSWLWMDNWSASQARDS